MQIFLCGVFSGTFTGQMQTLIGIESALKDTEGFKKLHAPVANFLFPFFWLSYIIKILKVLMCDGRNNTYYLMINRSRLSFWLRDLPIFLAASFSNSRLICHLVGSDLEEFIAKSNAIELSLIRIFFKRINLWVVLGKSMEEQLEKVYQKLGIKKSAACYKKQKISTFIIRGFYPNESNKYINDEDISNKVSSFGKNLSVCFMSNLIEEKGIVEFIESIIYLNETKNYNIKAWIAGVHIGSQSLRLQEAMKSASSKNYIDIVGMIMGKEKWLKLLETSIFILPSYYKSEALPLSLVEAMRSGCLCISSDVGEIDQILSSDNGYIIKTVNTANVVNSVEFLLNDIGSSKIKINNSYKSIKDEFSLSGFQNKVKEVVNL
jgi:glycosyltransferase involved in cell wall biosynthesis